MAEIEAFSPRHTDGVVRLCEAEGWTSWTPEGVAAAFTAPGVIALTAVEDAMVVGGAQVLTDHIVMAYLGLLVVERTSRGRGIGRSLVAEAFERCGLPRIDLLSESDSTSFYEALPHKIKPGYRLYQEMRDSTGSATSRR